MKRCIFHYPGKIENEPKVGSAVRPKMMLEAFRQLGYEVDVVTGESRERKLKIQEIKKNIRDGIIYDFLYSENRNIPTLLADRNHIPSHPLLDFNFFKFCRENGIKIGLFYRDIHWKFDIFKSNVILPKRLVLVSLFRYDLYQYKKYVNILYVPNLRLGQYLPKCFELKELPPGGNLQEDILEEKKRKEYSGKELRIFYVGGVTGLYDMKTLFYAVKKNQKVSLIACTPLEQWEKAKDSYKSLLCDRIQVVHKQNSELKQYYRWADVVSVCFEKNEYTALATPIKAFEAICYGVPLIVSNNTVISRKIDEWNIGWVIEYSLDKMNLLFDNLLLCPGEIREKTENIVKAAKENTWRKRAEMVIRDLAE